MTEDQPYLSFIIPAYNEETRLGKTLEAVFEYLKNQPFRWEILVVIDGAKDNTIGVVNKYQEKLPYLRVIDRKENKGKGYSVREGMLAAKGKVRLFADADNSTSADHFDKMKPLFDKGYEVVICSRDPKDAPGARQEVPQKGIKRLAGNLGNLFIQIFAVPGIWDTQCGFKAFSQKAAAGIFQRSVIDRWGFDVEALALARKLKYEVGIVPAYWVNDPHSHVKLSGYIKVLFETLQVRWNLITGKYEL